MGFEISLETNEKKHYVICLLSCPHYISWTPTFMLQAIQHVFNQKSGFNPHCGNVSWRGYKIHCIIINHLYSHSTLITFKQDTDEG